MCLGSKSDEQQPPPRRRQRAETAGSRRQHQNIPLQPVAISGPVTPPGQVPAPERDAHGLWVNYAPHDLTRQNLMAALGHVARYLHQHGEDVTLVTVGGAVNTVLLQSRTTTHDVDFFCRVLQQPRLGILRQAGQYAVERSSVPLSADWLNNATARMPGVVENIDSLVEAAVAQDAVLFRQPGLKVVAAPWEYAFIKKVSRITQGTGRQYDASNAVAYLHSSSQQATEAAP
ncbi:conserved hypothetical protein [Verticillium alfalfae VaMs.102]|uniref:Uncharacterized protein n=1 Tax=Verticillium alfalfae (strain VaMs.102 / ATCC MYA-4576 / FGSC 10136) TaxID=526221 RepID=C9SM17_VERA1|nr:conserved hypothetical protein [Verticillium alfalfae VaMs.102]EEY19832.1 conserved hypothetical protein [Verticillium alfalfae VaMs.102]